MKEFIVVLTIVMHNGLPQNWAKWGFRGNVIILEQAQPRITRKECMKYSDEFSKVMPILLKELGEGDISNEISFSITCKKV